MSLPKNTICVGFQQGYCAFGNHCRYLHSRLIHYDTGQSLQPRPYDNYDYNRAYTISDSNHYHQQRTHPYWSPKDEDNNSRPSLMDSFVDYNKETLIFDIDGTIADIRNRLNLCKGSNPDGTRTREEWDIVLNGDHYRYDRVIDVAYAYLKYIDSLNKYNIIYLSGRRSNTIHDTIQWMFNVNEYPKGFIIHRFKGMNGREFKEKQLLKLSRKLNIIGYFGDRAIDDCIGAIKTGIRPILVVQNKWLCTKHINGGIATVIDDGTLSVELMDIVRNSKYWKMPYNDLIPPEFATEVFYSENIQVINDEYSDDIESKNEDDDDDSVDVISDTSRRSSESKESLQRRVDFCHEQQKHIQQQYQWIPIGQSIYH